MVGVGSTRRLRVNLKVRAMRGHVSINVKRPRYTRSFRYASPCLWNQPLYLFVILINTLTYLLTCHTSQV